MQHGAGPMLPNGELYLSAGGKSAPPRIGSLWRVIVLFLWLGGCSSTSGLLIADVIRAEGAWVVAIEGCCASLRTVASNAGLTLGYDRRTYVYPIKIDDPPAEGRHYFVVPLPRERPVAVNTRAIGIDVRATGIDLGLTLGYRDATLLARAPSGDSVYMRLHFIADDVGGTRLIYCPEEDPCWPIDIPDNASSRR
jgi:hypothetical protein